MLGITPDDTTFSVAKMFFAYGIGNSVFFPFSVGADDRPRAATADPRRRARAARARPARRCSSGCPTFYAALAASDVPDDAFAIGAAVRVAPGEPLPAPLQRRFTDRFGVEILDGIGSTEALHIFLSNRPGDIRPGTTGRRRPGLRRRAARRVRPRRSRDGEPGALHVRGESIALGYWHRTDATRQVFQGRVAEHRRHLRPRPTRATTPAWAATATCSRPAGSGSRPAEVESRLLEHPAVREAAVVGVADADGLDKPVAVVVVSHAATAGSTEEELMTLVPRRARALQGAAQGRVRRRPAEDRHRQAAAVQGPRPGGRAPATDPTAELEVAP